jgi:DNA-binding MurR/RpiR family transcriptional regulator
LELVYKNDRNTDGDLLRLSIHNKYTSLPKAARQVADFLLEYPEQAVYMNISTLADKAGVSESTVTKFSRTIGYNSFAELKIALARGVKKSGGIEEDLLKNNVDRVQSAFLENIKSLQDTLTLLDVDKTYGVARSLMAARKTDIYGIGITSAVAEYLQIKMLSLGLTANHYEDPHKQQESAATLNEKDVAFGISVSGQAREIAAALAAARRRGAATICVTNQDNSPVVRESDVVMFTASNTGKKTEEWNTFSRVSEFGLVDALYEAMQSLSGIKK